MIFTPSTLATLWDTWLFYEDGTHYLFYLASTTYDRPWDGVGLATSGDGVHFEDHGLIVRKSMDAEWLGTGHTWRAGGQYLLNFAESRNGKLEIFFAESIDLLHWKRVPASESVSRLDPEWYSEGTQFSEQRWDNIWVLPSSDNDGFVGYVTAVGKEGPAGLQGTCGFVRSSDGRRFTTVAPVIEPGVWGDKLEIGGVERIDDTYYMLAAQAEIPLGVRWTAHNAQAAGGVYVLHSAKQEGPFVLNPSQPPLLVGSPRHYTYFARFYPTPDGMLASHHSIAHIPDIVNTNPKRGTQLAPLKRVRVDDGVMTLGWWEGNAALRGNEITVSVDVHDSRGLVDLPRENDGTVQFSSAGGGIVPLNRHFDLDAGVLIDFEAVVTPLGPRPGAAGLLIGQDSKWSGTVALLDTAGAFAIGDFNGYAFKGIDSKLIESSTVQQWRVLVRGIFVEVYVNDLLVQVFTLSAPPSGKLSLVCESAALTVRNVRAHQMAL